MFYKDPDAVLDYSQDWAAWLIDGDTITASTWDVDDGLTKDSDTHDATGCTVWLSGGTVGTIYRLTNRVTTAAGRVDDRTIRVKVQQR